MLFFYFVPNTSCCYPSFSFFYKGWLLFAPFSLLCYYILFFKILFWHRLLFALLCILFTSSECCFCFCNHRTSKLKVRDLLHAVGKKCGIDPGVIDNLDLENVVERTIAFNEGKEMPPDTNEEPPREPEPDTPISKKTFQKDENDNTSTKPPSEACPLLYQPSIRSKFSIATADLVIQNPTFETISQNSSAFAVNMMPFLNEREIVAIDIDDPEEFIEEPVINFQNNPLVVTRMNAIEVPRHPEIALPEDLSPFTPIMVFEDSEPMRQERRRSTLTRTPSAEEPKKFKEKREKYGRDPMKLYETYQEEWGRLERLSDKRLGTRRKSVLVSPSASPLHTVSPPPEASSPETTRKS